MLDDASLDDAIQHMYREIVDYAGAFGEIETGPYNPFELLRQEGLAAHRHEGVAVAVLCYLETSIDNSTHTDAIAYFGEQTRQILEDGLFDSIPLVKDAAEAFFDSEQGFYRALEPVYRQIVLARVQA